jgi:hypothetical protein
MDKKKRKKGTGDHHKASNKISNFRNTYSRTFSTEPSLFSVLCHQLATIILLSHRIVRLSSPQEERHFFQPKISSLQLPAALLLLAPFKILEIL